jgi:diguanylate cyclase (GGDEF)-like protein
MEELPLLLAAEGLRSWLESTHVLAALVDGDGHVVEGNPAFKNLNAAGALPGALASFVLLEDSPALVGLLRTVLEHGKPGQANLHLLQGSRSCGTEYCCHVLPSPGGRLIFLAEPLYFDPGLLESSRNLAEQVAQLARDNAQMKQQLADKQIEIDAVVMQAHEVANTDDLTFLSNRRQIIGDLQREVMRSERSHSPVAISMLDVDHFKKVNDTYGHAVGDMVLRSVARYLRDNIREPDIVGRYGGEEFLVILPNGRLQAAIEQGERLCRGLRANKMAAAGLELQITISIGVAEFRPGQEDWQKLLSRADSAMYEAKAQGRDRVSASR